MKDRYSPARGGVYDARRTNPLNASSDYDRYKTSIPAASKAPTGYPTRGDFKSDYDGRSPRYTGGGQSDLDRHYKDLIGKMNMDHLKVKTPTTLPQRQPLG